MDIPTTTADQNYRLQDSTLSADRKITQFKTRITSLPTLLSNRYREALSIGKELLTANDKDLAPVMLALARLFLEEYATFSTDSTLDMRLGLTQGKALLNKLSDWGCLDIYDTVLISTFTEKEKNLLPSTHQPSENGQQLLTLMNVSTGQYHIRDSSIWEETIEKMAKAGVPEACYLKAHVKILKWLDMDTTYSITTKAADNKEALSVLKKLLESHTTVTTEDKKKDPCYLIGCLFLTDSERVQTFSDDQIVSLGRANMYYHMLLAYDNLDQDGFFSSLSSKDCTDAATYLSRAISSWQASSLPLPQWVSHRTPKLDKDVTIEETSAGLLTSVTYSQEGNGTVACTFKKHTIILSASPSNYYIVANDTNGTAPFGIDNLIAEARQKLPSIQPFNQSTITESHYWQTHGIISAWLDKKTPSNIAYVTKDKKTDNEKALAVLQTLCASDDKGNFTHSLLPVIGHIYAQKDKLPLKNISEQELTYLALAWIHYDAFLAYQNIYDDAWFGLPLYVNNASKCLLNAIYYWKRSIGNVPEAVNKRIPLVNKQRTYMFGRHLLVHNEPMVEREKRCQLQKMEDDQVNNVREKARKDLLNLLKITHLSDNNNPAVLLDEDIRRTLQKKVDQEIPEAIYLYAHYQSLENDTLLQERLALLTQLSKLTEKRPTTHTPHPIYYSIGCLYVDPNKRIDHTPYQIECLGYAKIKQTTLLAYDQLGDKLPIGYYNVYEYEYTDIYSFYTLSNYEFHQETKSAIDTMRKKISDRRLINQAQDLTTLSTNKPTQDGDEVELKCAKTEESSEE